MSGTTLHWRLGDDTSLSACGRRLANAFFVIANVEAVTCGNCLRSRPVTNQRRNERRGASR